jgi:hypothetical protein
MAHRSQAFDLTWPAALDIEEVVIERTFDLLLLQHIKPLCQEVFGPGGKEMNNGKENEAGGRTWILN